MKPENPKKTTVVSNYLEGMDKPIQFILFTNVSLFLKNMTGTHLNFAQNIFTFWDGHPEFRDQASPEIVFLMDLFREVYNLHDVKDVFKRLGITESEFNYWTSGFQTGQFGKTGPNPISNT